jgi:hypothetical protein
MKGVKGHPPQGRKTNAQGIIAIWRDWRSFQAIGLGNEVVPGCTSVNDMPSVTNAGRYLTNALLSCRSRGRASGAGVGCVGCSKGRFLQRWASEGFLGLLHRLVHGLRSGPALGWHPLC